MVKTVTSKKNSFSHVGAVRIRDGSLRFVLEDRILAIGKTDASRLLTAAQPVGVYDMRDVLASSSPRAAGTAWISRSGRALMIDADTGRYVSPLAQVLQVAAGDRAGANLSMFARGR